MAIFIFAGYALNKLYIHLLTLCIVEWHSNESLQISGPSGLKADLSIALLLVNTPTLIIGLISHNLFLIALVSSSSFFALVEFLKLQPQYPET